MKAERLKAKPDAYERVKIGFEKLKLKWSKMKAQRLKSKRSIEQLKRRDAFFKLKKLLPRNIALPLDGILCAASGSFHLDVFRLEKQIPNYNGDKCTYKGKPKYSMSMAIKEEWGEEVANLIKDLL